MTAAQLDMLHSVNIQIAQLGGTDVGMESGNDPSD